MYFLALPNGVSMFHNLIGDSCTMSFTFHDVVFPVAWFSMGRQ